MPEVPGIKHDVSIYFSEANYYEFWDIECTCGVGTRQKFDTREEAVRHGEWHKKIAKIADIRAIRRFV